MPQPLDKSEELLDKLHGIDGRPSDFEFASLKREANKLLKANAAAGYMCLGIIASMQFDFDEVVRNFNAALSNSPSSFVILSNYGMSLRTLGEYEMAIEQFEKARSLPYDDAERVGGGSPDVTRDLLATYILVGHFLAAEDLAAKSNLDFSELVLESLALDAPEIASFMRANAISDAEIAPLFRALSAMADRNHESVLSLISKAEFRSYSSLPEEIFIEFKLPLSAEDVSDYQMTYIEKLAQEDYVPRVMDQVKFSFEVA